MLEPSVVANRRTYLIPQATNPQLSDSGLMVVLQQTTMSRLPLGCKRSKAQLPKVLTHTDGIPRGQGVTPPIYDKGKIVNYLLSISLCLFCIFLFIILVLCFFQCFMLILEGNRRNKLKWVKIVKFDKYLRSKEILDSGRLDQTMSWRRGASNQETTEFFLFRHYRHWAT